MSDSLRLFRENGIDAFREYLRILRTGAGIPPPLELLTSADTSQPIDEDIRIESITPENHFAMAQYLIEKLRPVPELCRRGNTFLWSWLSLYYFDLVCPVRNDGTRYPGRDYRHIQEEGYPNVHRHLLSGPYHLAVTYGELTKFLLSSSLHIENKTYHELCARQNFVSNRSIMEAAQILYCNSKTGRQKQRVAASKVEPGGIYRFITVIQQFELTYDLFSMNSEQILSLLPKEFDTWRL